MADPRLLRLTDTGQRYVILGDPLFARIPKFTYVPGGGAPVVSVFSTGAWNDAANWSDTDTWRDVA